MVEQPTAAERARSMLEAAKIDLKASVGQPMAEMAQSFARHDVPPAPGHHLLDDGACSCADDNCPTPGKHLIVRHLFSDPWQCRSRDSDAIGRWWRAHPQASIGFCLKLAGESFERQFICDGADIHEHVQITRIR